MVATRFSWRRMVASGVVFLALLVTHGVASMMPLAPAAAQVEMDGCHDETPATDHHKAVPVSAVCQACPGMALLSPEAAISPLRLSAQSYAPLSSERAEGLVPQLDPPPPKCSFFV